MKINVNSYLVWSMSVRRFCLFKIRQTFPFYKSLAEVVLKSKSKDDIYLAKIDGFKFQQF
jgi:hypothetical protein